MIILFSCCYSVHPYFKHPSFFLIFDASGSDLKLTKTSTYSLNVIVHHFGVKSTKTNTTVLVFYYFYLFRIQYCFQLEFFIAPSSSFPKYSFSKIMYINYIWKIILILVSSRSLPDASKMSSQGPSLVKCQVWFV